MDQAPLELSSTAFKSKYNWSSSKGPSNKAQEPFAWIPGPDGQETFHEQRKAERIAGTCEWFLNTTEFQSWLHREPRRGERAILWCQGRPGIGKMMLA